MYKKKSSVERTISLKDYLSIGFDTDILKTIELFNSIAESIESLYSKGELFKGFTTETILINPKTKKVDFSTHKLDNTADNNRDILLAYMSPEETGRTNKKTDKRSTLYSLGAIYYEIITGKTVFSTEDSLETIHYHLAKDPVFPKELCPEIPEILSDIIMKLLKKDPDDRYQSIAGLKRDLEICYLMIKEDALETFDTGKWEKNCEFSLSDKIYGRETELEYIHNSFKGVLSGKSRIVFICGYSGIGKTSLVFEFDRRYIKTAGADRKSLFGYGKFERDRQSTPFFGFISALRDIVLKILTKEESEIIMWKERILKKVGSKGYLITEFIPEAEYIIGKQKELPKLDSFEAQSRFKIVLQDFLSSLSLSKRPLILFLDDLQWIDNATLSFIEKFNLNENKFILLLCAYRDNEITQDHKLSKILIQMEKSSFNIINLGPLGIDNVKSLIGDSLIIDNKNQEFLSEIVNDKAGGNPFFIKSTLNEFYRRNIIDFNESWRINQKRAVQFSISKNLAESIIRDLKLLTNIQVDILKIASVIGRIFSMEVLNKICKIPANELRKYLLILSKHNLLLKIDENIFSFSHDSILEAVVNTIDTDEIFLLNYKIGLLLLDLKQTNNNNITVFDILKHLNNTRNDFFLDKDSQFLAELNLKAGIISKNSTAYSEALFFFKKGISFLPSDKWKRSYNLCLKLLIEIAKIGLYAGEGDYADRIIDEIIEKAENKFDKIHALNIRIINYTQDQKCLNAIYAGITALSLLGIHIPKRISNIKILINFFKIRLLLIKHNFDSLFNMEEINSESRKAAIEILINCCPSCIMGAPEFLPIFAFEMLHITLKYGQTSNSAYAFCIYGMILCDSNFKKYKEGCNYSALALRIADKFDDLKTKTRINYLYGASVNHWIKHIDDNNYLLKAYESGIKNCCDIQYASFSILNSSFDQLVIGKKLDDVNILFNEYSKLLIKFDYKFSSSLFNLYRQVLLNIKGKTEELIAIKGKYFNEDQIGKIWKKNNNLVGLFGLYFYKLFLTYLYKDLDQSLIYIREIKPYLKSVTGMIGKPLFSFYTGLIYIRIFKNSTVLERHLYGIKIRKSRKVLRSFSNINPINAYCLHSLLEAEYEALNNKNAKAESLYDRAIESARENGFNHYEAMANECAADYYLKKGKLRIAEAYMVEARDRYAYWGAMAKVRLMEEEYPDFFRKEKYHKEKDLDLLSIIKASQAIVMEQEVIPLLNKVLAIIIENAGATKGVFIIKKKNEGFFVYSRASVIQEKVVDKLPAALENYQGIPKSLIRYSYRTNKVITLSDSSENSIFSDSDYFRKNRIRSVLAIPLKSEGSVSVVLYLENRKIEDVFTQERVEILKAITKIIINILEKKEAEKELSEYQKKLRALSSELVLTEEKERRKIALGLHDQIGQNLTLSRLKLGMIKKDISEKSGIDEIIDLLDLTISDTRKLTFEVSPPDLYELGLEAAIDTLSEKMLEPLGIKVSFFDDITEKKLEESSKILLFQTVREILFNIIKHAEAEKVSIRITREFPNIKIVIKDDGKGFYTSSLPQKHSSGFGLFSIKERMNYGGGKIIINSEPGEGTEVTLLSPLKIIG